MSLPLPNPERTGEPRASELRAERRVGERRATQRPSAAASVDVSRIEHENLLKQVAAHEQAIRRLEEEVRRLREQTGAPRRPSKYPLVSD